MTQLYRIEEYFTDGWTLISENSKQLTKEECQRQLESYLADGYNPNYLRAVPDV
jgi:hypothetical protein